MTDSGHAAQLRAALHDAAPVGPPRGGDCRPVAAAVTSELARRGIAAATTTLAGWLDPDTQLLGFMHVITTAGGWALDATAQQYHPDAPRHWVAPLEIYLTELAALTGVNKVSTWP